MDRRVYLKIKIKSLAYEAKIIRQQEARCKGDDTLRGGLHSHRRFVVRPEARATLIAYGFLNGKSYREVEPKAKRQPDWAKVRSMVSRYRPPTTRIEEYDAWAKLAQATYEAVPN